MREAEITDAAALQRVLDEASGESNASIHGDGAASLLSIHRVYLGFVEEAVVGCVMATVYDGMAIIHNLAVSMRYRNRGHATTLVKSAMYLLNQPTELTYWAAADPGNPSAVKRFHTLGFSSHQDNEPREVILMVRRPGPLSIDLATLHRSVPPRPTLGFGAPRTTANGFPATASND